MHSYDNILLLMLSTQNNKQFIRLIFIKCAINYSINKIFVIFLIYIAFNKKEVIPGFRKKISKTEYAQLKNVYVS